MQYFLRHHARLSGQTAAIAMEKVKLSGARNRRDAMFIVTSRRSGVRARETESNGAAFNPLSLLWCAGAQLPPQRHRHSTPAAVYAILLSLRLHILHMTLRNHPCHLFCGEIAEPDYQVVNDTMFNLIILIITHCSFFFLYVLSARLSNETFTISIFSHFLLQRVFRAMFVMQFPLVHSNGNSRSVYFCHLRSLRKLK